MSSVSAVLPWGPQHQGTSVYNLWSLTEENLWICSAADSEPGVSDPNPTFSRRLEIPLDDLANLYSNPLFSVAQ